MPQYNIRKTKSENSRQSVLLILGMTGILSLIGWSLAGIWGLAIAGVLAFFGVFLGQRVSPRVVLKMYKAKPIHNAHSPELYSIFHELSVKAALDPMPGLFYVPSKIPNAFAVGHDQSAAVAVTDGLLRTMNPRELRGVLAHELAHLVHRDTHVMGLADTLSRITSFLSRMGLFLLLFSVSTLFSGGDSAWYFLRGGLMFFAPVAAVMLQLALSRSREFNADMGAIELTGDPYGLASALEKLDRLSNRQSFWQKVMRPGQKELQPALLRTHPPLDERIKKLLDLAKAQPSSQQAPMRPVRVGERKPEACNRLVISNQSRQRKKPRYHIMSGIFR